MKVILDTNVVVSAILRGRKPADVLLFVVEHPEMEWIVSSEIIQEYSDVLRRPKFAFPEATVLEWLEIIETSTYLVKVSKELQFPRDRKDAKFLSCALAADVDYFVTGDRDFESAQQLGNTKIVSVSMFKKLICDTWDR